MARIALLKNCGVATDAIEAVCIASELPAGEIALIIGDEALPARYQAATIGRDTAGGAAFGFAEFMTRAWDCGVSVGMTWAERQPEYPAYFSYLLAHEFGHATTVLTDLHLHVYEALIQDYLPAASGRKWSWTDLPFERAYDAFALAVVDEIHGRETFSRECAKIVDLGLTDSPERLDEVLRQAPRKDLGYVRAALAEFSLPYKGEFLRLWAEERRRAPRGLAAMLRVPEALWDSLKT